MSLDSPIELKKTLSFGGPLRAAGKLEDFVLPQELDGIEVRSVYGPSGGPYQGSPVLTYGDSCSTTTCMSTVAEIDARNEGWLQNRPDVGAALNT